MEIFFRGADRAHGKLKEIQERLQLTDLEALAPYLSKDQWIYIATLKYLNYISYEEFSLRGMKGLVIGSMEPWVEGWMVHLGFTHVVTSDYNQLTYNHSKITTISEGCRSLSQM
jgi:Caenorhabditis protein of unknown function, DUF268